MLRRLRIAAAVLSLTSFVLLALLWIRSYYRMDQLHGHLSKTTLLHVGSMRGQLTIRVIPGYPYTLKRNWIPEGESVQEILDSLAPVDPARRELLVYRFDRSWGVLPRRGYFFPHWWAVASTGITGLAAATGRPRRISLRGLLILMTVATVLVAIITAGS
jgi:hypothetical protein